MRQNTPENHTAKVAQERIQDLMSRRLFHAALEVCQQLVAETEPDSEEQAQALYRLGVIYFYLADYDTALADFERAANMTKDPAARCMYLVHTGIVLGRLQEYDKAIRVICDALADNSHQDTRVLATAYGNLGYIQGMQGNYQDAVANAYRSLELFQQSSGRTPYFEIYNNIGLAYLEARRYKEAEEYFLKTVQMAEGCGALSPLTDLSRVYLLTGDIQKSVNLSVQAMQLVWSSSLSFDKDEIARLCRHLATLCHRLGEKDLAFHLIEKAELMLGQLGLWREWSETQAQMDEWLRGEIGLTTPANAALPLADIERFARLLDVMIAQELMGKKLSAWIDTRVLYASVFAEALQLSPEDQDKFAYASRFADYGLTALEPDILANPRRSRAAWEQYQRHPELSAVMLKSLDLDLSIAEIIAAHHERYDGSGFPSQKAGSEIPYLARVLAVVDYYAEGVVMQEKPHSQVLQEIHQASGQSFDPDVVAQFEDLFAEPHA